MTRHRSKGEYLPDRGCHVHPACLECPLPQCVFDLGEDANPMAHVEERNRRILESHAAGETAEVLAQRWGISTRTVFRITHKEGG